MEDAMDAYYADPSIENRLNWSYTFKYFIVSNAAFVTSDAICSMFMLFMLHKFSTLPATQLDPVTRKQVPVLSQIQSTATLKELCKDKALSDKAREEILKHIDLEKTKEIFEGSEVSSSIASSFVLADVRSSSMASLRGIDYGAEAVYSEDHAVPTEELTGEDLQMALKGKPIPGSLTDDTY